MNSCPYCDGKKEPVACQACYDKAIAAVDLRDMCSDLDAQLRSANLQVGELRAALEDAISDLESWADYAPDWAKEKHGLEGDLKKHRDALKGKSESRLGSSPTERKCCVDAYARGYEVGRYHGLRDADSRVGEVCGHGFFSSGERCGMPKGHDGPHRA